MRALIVDDEQASIKNLEDVLKNLNSEVKIFKTDNAEKAEKICREQEIDVAFLDIRMPGKDGLSLAKAIKQINSRINIVIVTAYKEYAIDALRIFVSGYVLKPAMEDEVREVLENLRNPLEFQNQGLFVKCFGNFEIFYDGKPLKFKRSKSKEFLAYLIDRRGATVTIAEMGAILFDYKSNKTGQQRNYLHKIYYDLRETLGKIGCENILNHYYNSYSVLVDKINCDYYLSLKNPVPTSFHSEYMSQYSWAETSLGRIYLKMLSEEQ